MLGEWEEDEEGEPLPVPDEIDGKKVIGIEDDYIVGGELGYWDDGSLTYSAGDLARAIRWIDSERFKVTPELVQELRRAAE